MLFRMEKNNIRRFAAFIGKVKTLGVSNFSIRTLSQILQHCKIVPAVNQVEMHPCWPQDELKAFCKEKGILLTAYSPLGTSYS